MKKIFASLFVVGLLGAGIVWGGAGCNSNDQPDARIAITPGTPDAATSTPDAKPATPDAAAAAPDAAAAAPDAP